MPLRKFTGATTAPILAFSAVTAMGAELTEIAALSQGATSKRFVQTVSVPIAEGCGEVERVTYGHEAYGYFTPPEFSHEKNAVQFELIPPGYRHPTEIHLDCESGGTLAVLREFESPVAEPLRQNTAELKKSGLSQPYYLTGGSIPYATTSFSLPEKRKNASFAAIVNRLGELVWLHFPDQGRRAFTGKILARPLSPGRIGILLSEKQSYFEVVDTTGTVQERYDPHKLRPFFTLNGDFRVTGEHILAGSRRLGYIRSWENLFSQPDAYASAVIRRISRPRQDTPARRGPTPRSSAVVWDAFNWFQPTTDPTWKRSKNEPKNVFVSWEKPLARFDYARLSSLEKTPDGGFLVVLEKPGRVLKTGPNLNSVEWTLGSGPNALQLTADAQPPRRPVHASVSRSGHVMVVNAGEEESTSLTEYAIDSEHRTARKTFQYTPKGFGDLAPGDGSAVRLEGGNILAFFQGSSAKRFRSPEVPPDHVVEIDPESKRVQGHMTLSRNFYSPARRVYPLKTLTGETLVTQ